MSKQTTPPVSEKPSRQELRASLLLPIIITIIVWLIGLLVYAISPEELQFNQLIGGVIGAALIIYLLYSTRNAALRLRITAFLMAIPALVGMTIGMINGRSTLIVAGIGITFLLLIIQRALTVPFSYRAALQAYRAGNYDQAQQLINKSIAARPDFAESYQLRGMIHLMNHRLGEAEKDVQSAIERQPTVDAHYNALGQIYLAAGRYQDAIPVYQQAGDLNGRQAMHDYHLGLCHYRLEVYQEAAEAFAAATRKTIPNVEYDLLTHYYLWHSLTRINRPNLAVEALEKLPNFSDGLTTLEAQIQSDSTFEHINQLQQDIAEIKNLLANSIKNNEDGFLPSQE
ncbi:MAG: tetratricopeptide repeat protein [Chloroflexi bacterium]|nr:tetratricopeptide repeat protein [Chloroflexota bacterium]